MKEYLLKLVEGETLQQKDTHQIMLNIDGLYISMW